MDGSLSFGNFFCLFSNFQLGHKNGFVDSRQTSVSFMVSKKLLTEWLIIEQTRIVYRLYLTFFFPQTYLFIWQIVSFIISFVLIFVPSPQL